MSKNLEKERTKVNNKRKKGVSLIALVITIIVIIILAMIAFFASTGTVEKANYAKFTTNISEVESKIREKALSLKGDEASRGKQLTDGQIYNYVAKGGKTDSDYLNESSTPKYTIINEASNINLPEMKVNTPAETGVKIIYAVTDKGEVFIWPPYGYDNEYYVTGSEKVDKDKAEEPGAGDIDIKIDDNIITIKKDEDGKIKNEDETSPDKPDVPTKIKLTKPSVTGSYIYNGNTQTVTLSVFDSNTMIVTGNTRKDAGSQEVTVSLKDTSKYEWSDGTTSAVVINWTVAKKTVSVSWSNLNFEYDGANHVPTATLSGVVAGDAVSVNVSGTASAEGEHTATATLTGSSTENYELTNTTTKFTIVKTTVNVSTLSIILSGTSFTYTGAEIKPTVTIKNGATTLSAGTDYTLSYGNNIKAGTATITIKGNGKYVGTTTKNFTIERAKTATATASNKSYTGSAQIGVTGTNVDLSGTTSATNVGTYTATATPKANYAWSDGTTVAKTLTWKITEKASSSLAATLATTTYTYDGTAKEPVVTVKDGSTTLTLNTHYTVAYSNNTNAGTATVTITMKGNYSGTITKNFTIERAKTASATASDKIYNGSAQIGVTGTNVDLSGTTSATNVGTYTATATPKANYAWSDGTTTAKTLTWKITEKASSSLTATLATTTYTYDKTAKEPVVTVKDGSTTLTLNTHYTVTYSNNTNAGTATVTITMKGNYSGTITKNFTIERAKTASATASDKIYNASAQIGVTGTNVDLSGTTSATSVGTYTATATPKANYAWSDGTTTAKTLTWKITEKASASLTVTLATTTYTYDGTAKEPAVTVKDGSTTLTSGTHYTVSYSNNTNAGTATVTITMKGNYSGTITKNFTIERAKTASTTVSDKIYNGSAQTGVTGRNVDLSGTTSATSVGTYTATAIPKANYAWSDGTTTAKTLTWKTIAKTLTVTPTSGQAKTYGTSDNVLTYTYEGQVSGQTPALEGALARETGENVGTYTINKGTLALKDNGTFLAKNYTLVLSSTTVSFTINKKQVSAEWGSEIVFIYDGKEHAPTVTIPTGVTGETIDVSITGKQINASDTVYTATAVAESVTGGNAKLNNYEVTGTTKEYTISKREVMVVWTDTEIEYTGEIISPTATADSKVEGEIITLAVTGGETAPGTHTAIASIAEVVGGQAKASNYNLTNTSIEFEITKHLQVGDYVNYVPETATYTTDSTRTGTNSQTLTTANDTKWRVLSIDETTGEVVLTTDGAVNAGITLSGDIGYLYGAKELNLISKNLYSNKTKGIYARSMTIEDLDKAVGYDPTTDSDYGKEYTYTSGTFYTYEENGKTVTSSTPKVASSSNPVTVKNTYYGYNPSSNNSTVGNILGSRRGWLASPCVFLYSKGAYACYGLRTACTTGVGGYYSVYSTGLVITPSMGVRPVVSLSSKDMLNLEETGKDGLTADTAWNIIGVDITGEEKTESTLTLDTSKIPSSYKITSKQWYSSDTQSVEGGTAIENATGDTYKVGLSMAKKYIYVVVKATAPNGTEVELKAITQNYIAGLAVGDYVNYVPTNATYSTDSTKTGYDSQTLTTSDNAKWRVLSIDEKTGEVVLTTDGIVNEKGITLKGATGYLYGAGELNTIAKNLYSSSNKGIYARSMTIEDLDKACGYVPSTNLTRIAWYPSGTADSNLKDVTAGNYTYIAKRHIAELATGVTYPRFYNWDDKNGVTHQSTSESDYVELKSETEPILITTKWYGYDPSNLNSIIGEILGGYDQNRGWLASTYVFYSTNSDIYYGLRAAYTTGVYGYDSFTSTAHSSGPSYGLRPVISVNRSLLKLDDESKDGLTTDTAWELSDLKIGDYVNYVPTSKTVTTDTSKTGYDTAQTLTTQSDTEWRVFDINWGTGEVLLTTQGATNRDTKVTLQGATGYVHGAEELNRICKELYSNTEKGITARSMTIEDLNKAVGYDPTSNSKYGKECTHTSGTFYTYEENGKTVTSETPKVASSSNPVTVKETNYYYNPSSKNSTVGNILGSSYGWLASPDVNAPASPAYFNLRIANSSKVGGRSLCSSGGSVYTVSDGLHPVVSLSSKDMLNLEETGKDGLTADTAWNIIGVDITGEEKTESILTLDTSKIPSTYKVTSKQWYSNDSRKTTGGTAIANATENTYLLTSNEANKYIYVVVTAQKADGTTKQFTAITTESVKNLEITVTLGTTTYTYDGTAKEPVITVKDGSTTLTSGTHYTVSYSNNTNAGTATVTITMKGNYSDTITKNFTIERAKTASATASDKTYNGSAQMGVTGTNVDLSGTTSATNVGTYTATATPKANYAWSDGTTTAKTLTWKTIAKTLTVTPTSGQGKAYGTSDNVLTYTYGGQVSGQTPAFEGALARGTGENPGDYIINKGTLALKDNGTFLAKNYTLVLSSTTVCFTIFIPDTYL